MQNINRKNILFVLGLLSPGLLLFLVTVLVPAVYAVRYSFYDMPTFMSKPEFVGLGNYADLMKDSRVWRDLYQTLYYAGFSVLFQLLLGVVFALVLNQSFAGRTLLRGAAIIPYILPTIVVTIGWQWMLDNNFGIVNEFIRILGFDEVSFLSVKNAMWTSIFISVWAWSPFVTLVFLAGLQTVPAELYESATLDGAGAIRRFWHVTLPMLKDVIITIVLLRGIWMFNKFDLIWLLTAGGPLERTEILPVLTYLHVFKFHKIGYGAALSIVALAIVLAAMLLFLRLSNAGDSPQTKKA